MTVFETLNGLNVNGHTEQKAVDGGRTTLTYLSWPWAWAEVKKRYPDAHYEVVKNENGLPYFADEKLGIMVYTRVTIDGVTHEMWLPVMDGNNRAMRFEPYEIQGKYKTVQVKAATMFDVNKTVMRCLVKNLAMFGLGLYIYAGEDLPEAETEKALDEAVNDQPEDAVTADTVLELPKRTDFNAYREISLWCIDHGGMQMGQFVELRTRAINAGQVPDIPCKELTEEQLKELIAAIEPMLKGENK